MSVPVADAAAEGPAADALDNQPPLAPVLALAEVSELTGRIAQLEDQLQGQAARMADLEQSLRRLVSRIRRAGGYSLPEDQQALWEAERLLAEEGVVL